MVDNQHNYYHTAPDKGPSNGPVWAYSGSLANYMRNLRNGTVIRGGYAGSNRTERTAFSPAKAKRQSTDTYWLPGLAALGAVGVPFPTPDTPLERSINTYTATE